MSKFFWLSAGLASTALCAVALFGFSSDQTQMNQLEEATANLIEFSTETFLGEPVQQFEDEAIEMDSVSGRALGSTKTRKAKKQ